MVKPDRRAGVSGFGTKRVWVWVVLFSPLETV